MVSELGLDNIWPLFCPKKNTGKIVEITILVYFDVFFAPIWVEYYQN